MLWQTRTSKEGYDGIDVCNLPLKDGAPGFATFWFQRGRVTAYDRKYDTRFSITLNELEKLWQAREGDKPR